MADTPDSTRAYLEAARKRYEELQHKGGSGYQWRSVADVPVLLRAVEAVLELAEEDERMANARGMLLTQQIARKYREAISRKLAGREGAGELSDEDVSRKPPAVRQMRKPGDNQCPSIMPGPPPAIGEYRCELGAGHGVVHSGGGAKWPVRDDG